MSSFLRDFPSFLRDGAYPCAQYRPIPCAGSGDSTTLRTKKVIFVRGCMLFEKRGKGEKETMGLGLVQERPQPGGAGGFCHIVDTEPAGTPLQGGILHHLRCGHCFFGRNTQRFV